MARYYVNESYGHTRAQHTNIEWDGTLDGDGYVDLGPYDNRCFLPSELSLIEETPKGDGTKDVEPRVEIVEEEVVTTKKTFVLRLTEEEAEGVRRALYVSQRLQEVFGVYTDLEEALQG